MIARVETDEYGKFLEFECTCRFEKKGVPTLTMQFDAILVRNKTSAMVTTYSNNLDRILIIGTMWCEQCVRIKAIFSSKQGLESTFQKCTKALKSNIIRGSGRGNR